MEFVRVLKLNKYHYGNYLGIGNKKTIVLGELFSLSCITMLLQRTKNETFNEIASVLKEK